MEAHATHGQIVQSMAVGGRYRAAVAGFSVAPSPWREAAGRPVSWCARVAIVGEMSRPSRLEGCAVTRSRGLGRITRCCARWLAPWIAVLFVSVTLGYAMDSAINGWVSAGDRQPEVQGAAPSTDEAAIPTALEQLQESQSDSAAAPTVGRFGVASTTTPASTGHASSDGCCTWD
jgi:hypothetical protein